MANAALLRDRGCVYLGPERLRRDLLIPSLDRPMRALRRKLAPLQTVIEEAQGAGHRLLLSNENMIGGPRPPVIACESTLYPRAHLQIAALLEVLDLSDVTVSLALRNPLDMLASAWGHQYLAGRPIEFDAFAAGVAPEALRWSEMLARLAACPRIGEIRVWRFEDFRDKTPELVRLLAGLPEDTPLEDPPKTVGWAYLVGPSARAMASLPRVMRRNPELSAKDAMRRAMRRYPKSPRHPGPQPFSADARARAAAQYADDWAEITRLPRIRCLLPQHAHNLARSGNPA